ncbi:MAG TPA: methionyl-tRNA formyltransferase [Candidatus Paceibacterota bacterium]|nr:methionyl-tRNA formyltransferase [Candidatus Paceibacterota bacterium]HMP18871.1 methionyl-tRNA formyltransferase [Candidatus Paceibacterota bacterium]HMP85165.1 methionyl-tRNA formyltransferase [Candidatus Paceibacterota bacterium]
MSKNNLKFIFFGTDFFSVKVLEELKKSDLTPLAIVTAPDRKSGRGQKLQKPPAKIWVENNFAEQIKVLQPEKLDDIFLESLKSISPEYDFFAVASYGKIIPKKVIDLPKFKALNVHPSLLPFYRGASPIESAILDDQKETGVTIMLMDEKMDHGPILNQEIVFFEEWSKKILVEEKMALIGGKLLTDTINDFVIKKEIEPQEQNHETATFTKKITKEMGQINFTDLENENKSREIFLKIQALNPWPGVFFFIKHLDKEIRVKITNAKFENQKLIIETVIPEGKKEMSFADFNKGFIK